MPIPALIRETSMRQIVRAARDLEAAAKKTVKAAVNVLEEAKPARKRAKRRTKKRAESAPKKRATKKRATKKRATKKRATKKRS